jgi:hypothetical protein
MMTMKIRVECYAGFRGEQEPRAFTLGERRFEVVEILDRWLDPQHRTFKVSVADRRKFLLRQDTGSGEWELAGLVGERAVPPPGGSTLH